MSNRLQELAERVLELEKQMEDLRSGVESNETRLDVIEDAAGQARLSIAEINYLKQMFES